MRVRKNVRQLSVAEKRAFVEALTLLKDPVAHPSRWNASAGWSRYDDFVAAHLHAMHHSNATSWAHNGPAFFPWHRELLYWFEQELQALPGYADVTIPYWDWTRDRTATDPGWPFTYDFLHGNGDVADQKKVKRDPAHATEVPYPHGFDPETWTIRVTDASADPTFLQRNFGGRADATTLPNNGRVASASTYPASVNAALAAASYDVAPWVNFTPDYFASLRQVSENMHNLVHRYVGGIVGTDAADTNDPGGTMYKMTSTNDPVFWLHHAALDRLWSIWHEVRPTATAFAGPSAAPLGHRAGAAMIFGHSANTPWAGSTNPDTLADGHTIHGTGVWYDSDAPELTLETPSLNFGNVPVGMRIERAIRFRVRGGREMRFRIQTAPAAPFAAAGSLPVVAPPPALADDFTTAQVWIAYTATLGSSPSTVTVEAYFVDAEGYYATTDGGNYTKAAWSFAVTLVANPIPRERYSIALVLDRSGSMAAGAGGTSTRASLMKDAVSVFAALVGTGDQLGLVSFDDVIDAPLPLTAGAGASAAVNTVLASGALDPRGMTSIGGGIERGRTMLNGAAAGNQRAMLVLTDGHENTAPLIAAVSASIDARTYAIGFGLPGQVSTGALTTLTSNTGGNLVITGTIDAQVQQFRLTKYFVQMIAGILKNQIVLDPDGDLVWGAEQVVEFQLAAADVEAQVIVLCPVPLLLDFQLRTPGGRVFKPGSGGATVTYHVDRLVAFYRIDLPAVPDDERGSHAGTWQARLKLIDRDRIARVLRENKAALAPLAGLDKLDGSLPYSLVVHTRSNLTFTARAEAAGTSIPGDVALAARLQEYNAPFAGRAHAWADIETPDGTTRQVAMAATASGEFAATFRASQAGVFRCRIRAEGVTREGDRFTRELAQNATFFPAGGGGGGNDGERPARSELCKLLHCLTEAMSPALRKRLDAAGFDLGRAQKCVERALCAPTGSERRAADVEADADQRGKGDDHDVHLARLIDAIARTPEWLQTVGVAVVAAGESVPLPPPAPKLDDMEIHHKMWEPVDRSTMEHAFKHLNDGTCLHREGERCVHGLGHQHDKAVGTTTTAVVTTVSPITSITPGPHGGHGTVIPPAATTSAPMSTTIDAPPAPAPAHGTHFAGVDEATLSEARRKQSKPED